MLIPENPNHSVFALEAAAAVFQRQPIRVGRNFHPPETGLQRPDPGNILKDPGVHTAKGIVIITGDARFAVWQNRIP